MDEWDDVEEVLRRYRPMGASEELRRRVTAISDVRARPERVGWFGPAMAAMVMLALGLDVAARRTVQRTASEVGSGPVVWGAAAESAVRAMGGDEVARRYVAERLAS